MTYDRQFLKQLLSEVGASFEVSQMEIIHESKRRRAQLARYAAVWALRMTGDEYSVIARKLGYRDHTGPLRAYTRALELIQRDPLFLARLKRIECIDELTGGRQWSTKET